MQLAVRYSLPVFFRAAGASIAEPTWAAALENSQLELRATNQGERRVRITDLRVVATDGTTATVSQGSPAVPWAMRHTTGASIYPLTFKSAARGSNMPTSLGRARLH